MFKQSNVKASMKKGSAGKLRHSQGEKVGYGSFYGEVSKTDRGIY
jgi:hypothetical protein